MANSQYWALLLQLPRQNAMALTVTLSNRADYTQRSVTGAKAIARASFLW